MPDTVLIAIVISAVVIGLGVLLYVSWTLDKKQVNVQNTDEASQTWEEIMCFNCSKPMQEGYCFAGAGITWIQKNAIKSGSFSSPGAPLKNTSSMRMPPPLNLTWYCEECKIILIDTSKMLKFNK